MTTCQKTLISLNFQQHQSWYHPPPASSFTGLPSPRFNGGCSALLNKNNGLNLCEDAGATILKVQIQLCV